jgi:hypothetical protein
MRYEPTKPDHWSLPFPIDAKLMDRPTVFTSC